ncbi:MAG: adenylate/guanylate cyclase domain-containing protein [Planctomycetota bacterium]|jgi:class 3 adenylate cyclase
MTEATVKETVLFADIAGSTRLYEEQGDKAARGLIMSCLGLMASIVRNCGGRVVERIGDEILCTFTDADLAATAACALQTEVAFAHIKGKLPCPMRIRIGFAHGPVIESKEGIFGNTVHSAARLASLAKPGQTLTTKTTLARLNPDFARSSRFFDSVVLKGQRGEQEIHELVWSVTATSKSQLYPAARKAKRDTLGVELECGGRTCRVDANAPRLELGRDPACDLCVDGISVSQLHAIVVWNRGKVWLEDISTNGTFIEPEGASPTLTHHEVVPLRGSGTLRLGGMEEHGTAVVSYRCEVKGA